MCYEFAHPCDDVLLKKITVIGGDGFFLICIGNLNYLFSDDFEAIDKIRGLLFLEHVVLHVIPEEELNELLLVPETIEYQKFHGSKRLYQQFVKRKGTFE